MASNSILVKILGTTKGRGGLEDAVDDAGGILSSFAGTAGKFGLAAGGAVVAGLGKGTLDALNQDQLVDSLAGSLGLSEADAEKFGAVAGDIYAGAWGESFEDVTSYLDGTLRAFGDDLDSAEAFGLTTGAIDISETFKVDPERLTQTAGLLLRNGLADTAEGSLDVVTAALQQIEAPAGDVLDTLYEFSEPLNSLGIDGATAVGVLANAAEAGVFDLTKAGDALKELSIRAIDGSAASAEAYQALGLDATATAEAIASGGPAAQAATSEIIQALLDIEDPLAQDAAGVALFGTTWEDLGVDAIAALDPMLSSIEDVDGATQNLSDTVNDNLATRFEAVKRQAFQGLADVAEAVVLPALEKLLPVVEDVGAYIGERLPGWIETGQAALDKIKPVLTAIIDGVGVAIAAFNGDEGDTEGGFAGFMAAIGGAIGTVVTFLEENLPPALETAEEVLGTVATFIDENVVPVLTALVDGFVAVYEWVEENWPAIEPIISEAAGLIAAVIGRLAEGITTFVSTIRELWAEWGDEIITVVQFAWGIVEPIILGTLTVIEGALKVFRAIFEGDWGALWEGVQTIITGLDDILSGIVQGIFDAILAVVTTVMGSIQTEVEDKWGEIVGFLEGLPGTVSDAVTGLFDGIKTAFADAINFVIDGWNGLEFALPAISVPGLGEVFGGTTIGTPNIPRLATGGAIFAPMLAVVGDNPGAPSGDPEIVAPQSFIRDALEEVLDSRGSGITIETINVIDRSLDEELRTLEALYA